MYKVVTYDDNLKEAWDKFVLKESINGTFLQTRHFLSYHPIERFKDCSLLVKNERDEIVAVCPACAVDEQGQKTFYSHKGSTYGGIVYSSKVNKVKYILPLILELEQTIKELGFEQIYLRITSELLACSDQSLMEWALYYYGYDDYKELNPYIDYTLYKEDILSNFSQGKRTHVHKCERKGMETHVISNDAEVIEYYGILKENLSKYDLKPVHTVQELLEFKNQRLKNECEFLGTYLDGEMIAGGMMFYFTRTEVAHTQYLSAKMEYLRLSPVTYLYYWIIDEMRKRGYKKLSWGICTEDYGKFINEGLISSKEDFGSSYSNNHIFHKQI